MILRCLAVCALAVLAVAALTAQGPRPGSALLVDGHAHVTNRVYWEGIDPWKPQPAGQFDYARAWQGGANVVIENNGSLDELRADVGDTWAKLTAKVG